MMAAASRMVASAQSRMTEWVGGGEMVFGGGFAGMARTTMAVNDIHGFRQEAQRFAARLQELTDDAGVEMAAARLLRQEACGVLQRVRRRIQALEQQSELQSAEAPADGACQDKLETSHLVELEEETPQPVGEEPEQIGLTLRNAADAVEPLTEIKELDTEEPRSDGHVVLEDAPPQLTLVEPEEEAPTVSTTGALRAVVARLEAPLSGELITAAEEMFGLRISAGELTRLAALAGLEGYMDGARQIRWRLGEEL